jgi:hypothetical protein
VSKDLFTIETGKKTNLISITTKTTTRKIPNHLYTFI